MKTHRTGDLEHPEAALRPGAETEPPSRPQDALRAVVVAARAALGVGRCALYLVEPHGALFRGRVADADDPRGVHGIERLVCGNDADDLTREILATRRPVAVHNAQTDPRPVRAAMRRWDVRSVLGAPVLAHGEIVGLLFFDDPGRARRFGERELALAASLAPFAGLAVAEARHADEAARSAAAALRQSSFLRRSAAIEERFVRLALAGADLAQIAASVTATTKNPCAIHDRDGRRLTQAPADAQRPFASLLDPEPRRQPDVAAAIGALEADAPEVIGPFAAVAARRCLVAPIVARGETLGHLSIVEQERRLTPLDRVVARRAAAIAAFELLAAARAASAEGEARAALMRDLERGTAPAAELRARARSHGVAVDAVHAIAIVQARDAASARHGTRDLECALREAGWRGTALAHAQGDGRIVLLLELAGDVPAPEGIQRAKRVVGDALRRIAPRDALRAGLSSACRVPHDCPRGFEEAGLALEHLAAGAGQAGETVLASDDLGVGRLLLGAADRSATERFAHQVLGPLLDREALRADEVLETLRVFLSCSRNVRHTAEELGVHQNTVRYRLARAAEITGLDFATNGEHQLAGHLAFTILRLQGAPATASAA